MKRTFYLFIIFLFYSFSTLWAQTQSLPEIQSQSGCGAIPQTIVDSFYNPLPGDVGIVSSTTINIESPAGAADPSMYEAVTPGTINDYCGSGEGPDFGFEFVVPVGERVTCAAVTIDLFKLGDFNNGGEWIVFFDESNEIIGCIAPSGPQCGGGASATIFLDGNDITAMADDGLVRIEARTQGGTPGTQGSETDDVCAQSCIRVERIQWDVFVKPSLNSALATPDICVGESVNITADSSGDLPIKTVA